MAWQAEESTLAQLAGYLNDTLNARDQAVRKNAEQVRHPALYLGLIIRIFEMRNGNSNGAGNTDAHASYIFS